MYNFFDGTFRKPDGKAAFTSLTRVLIRFCCFHGAVGVAKYTTQPLHPTTLAGLQFTKGGKELKKIRLCYIVEQQNTTKCSPS